MFEHKNVTSSNNENFGSDDNKIVGRFGGRDVNRITVESCSVLFPSSSRIFETSSGTRTSVRQSNFEHRRSHDFTIDFAIRAFSMKKFNRLVSFSRPISLII